LARTNEFLKNSIATAMLQIFTLIVGFILPRVLLKAYGSEINGLVTSLTQFIKYFMIVEAGLASAAVYALYKPLSDNDIDGINGVVSAAKKFYIQSGWIFLLLVLVLAITYPFFVEISVLNAIQVRILVLILGVTGVLDFFTLSKYRVLLTAAQKVSVISLASITNLFLNLIITVVLARLHTDIIILKIVALTGIIARSLILMGYVKKRYPLVKFNAKPNTAALNKRWSALYLQILGVIQQGTPVVLATIFTSLGTVSVYSIYNMIIAGLNGILSIFISGLSSSFGDVIARKQSGVLKQSTEEFEVGYYMILTWAYGCAAALIMPFIKIYTSGITDIEYYYPALGMLFVMNGLLYNIKTPQGMLVISAGMFQETKVQTTIQGAIAIILGLILVNPLGLNGIMIGLCLSNLYRDIDLLYFVPRNITFRTIRPTFWRILRIFFCLALILFPYYFIAPQIEGIGQWLLHAVLIGVYAALVILATNFVFDRVILEAVYKRISLLIRNIVSRGAHE
jgi:O-antigen/teichoic acid export membrane protein